MRIVRICAAIVTLLALSPLPASAKQDDGLLEHLSGPGPFIRFPSLDIRVACITTVNSEHHTVGIAPWGRGSTSEFGFKPYVAKSNTPASVRTAKEQCAADKDVRAYLTVAWGHYTGVQNNLFPNNVEDDVFKVKAESVNVRFMGRALDGVVDVGFGFDLFFFYGKAFDRITRFGVEPFRVSVAPFAAIESTPRTRAFRLAVAPTILFGSLTQDDFCNTSACTVVPRQFATKAETQWATTVELDILTLIKGN